MKSHQITFAIIVVIQLQTKGQGSIKASCGRRLVHHTSLITNGFASIEGSAPWHAAIYHATEDGNKYRCGGTVLNSYTILTAAHCVYEHSQPIIPQRVLVYLGKYHLKYFGSNTREFRVYEIISHFNFNISNLKNDIAIIRLATEATFNNYIQPICLWDSNKMPMSELTGKNGTIIGWGATELNELSPILRHSKIPVVSLITCLNSNPSVFGDLLSDSNFCAGLRNGTSACNGDSGGSMSIEENGVYFIRGIVSLSPADLKTGLCKSTEYVLFTDVAKYLTWIEEMVPQLKQSASISGNCRTGENCGQRDDSSNIGLDKTEIVFAEYGSCLIPQELPDAIKVYYEVDTTIEIPKGSYAREYTAVVYRCRNNSVLKGKTTNTCLKGQWVADHPACQIYCSPLAISGITVTASCQLFDESISCEQPFLPPQTIAHIKCAVGYRKLNRTAIDVLNCKNDGEWDYDAFRCEPTCGKEAPEVVPSNTGGQQVNTTIVPWHVVIYWNRWKKEGFSQICGGTIINAKLVISAAHCFWDSLETQFYEAKYFKVGVGKYYRDLNALEPIKPQFRDISSIKHREGYNDYRGDYTFDIALLILANHIEFNTYIKPICLENDLNYNEKFVSSGLVGKVAGWELQMAGENKSKSLKHIDLSTVTYNQCKKNLTSEYLITGGDKFCASYKTEQIVCQGEYGGGGFVYAKEVGGSKLYFLRGVASVIVHDNGSCNNEKFSLFTNIQYYIDMIEHYELETRPK